MRKFAFALVLAGLLLGLNPASYGQGGVGELTGVVYDATGAVVGDAKVKLENPGTGFQREMPSTNAGVYRFSVLIVGRPHTSTLVPCTSLFPQTNCDLPSHFLLR